MKYLNSPESMQHLRTSLQTGKPFTCISPTSIAASYVTYLFSIQQGSANNRLVDTEETTAIFTC